MILSKVTKTGLHPISRKRHFGKTTVGVKLTPAFLGFISLIPLLPSPFLIYSHPELIQNENLYKISSVKPSLPKVSPHPLSKIL